MSHNCIWRSKKVWQDQPPNQGSQISQRIRVQQCRDCGQERNAKALGERRRERGKIRLGVEEPSLLRQVLSAKRWTTVEKVLAKVGGNRLEIEALLLEWLDEGWIAVEEKQPSHLGGEWQLQRVRLSAVAYEQLIAAPAAQKKRREMAALASYRERFEGWHEEAQRARKRWFKSRHVYGLIKRITTLLAGQMAALERNEWQPLPDTNQQVGGAVHRRWLLILRGLLTLLAHDEGMYERAFSAQWLGDSKALSRELRPLSDYLGVDLLTIGLYRHTPIALCWGAFTATYKHFKIDGQAGTPFIALAADTIRALQIDTIHAKAILVIENQTAFEALHHPPLHNPQLLYLFSHGHPGAAQRHLLAHWLQHTPTLPWYIWSDLDVGGVRIQQDWAQWAAEKQLPAPHPWLWDMTSLSRWQHWGMPLSDELAESLRALNHPLAERLLEMGYTLEQEAIISELRGEDVRGFR